MSAVPVKLGITLPSFRDRDRPVARGRRRGRGRRPRRRVRLRPPLPRDARRHPPARARDVRGDGRGRRRDDARIAVGSLVAARHAAAARDARERLRHRWRASSAPTGCSSRSARRRARAARRTRPSGSSSAPSTERVAALRDAVDADARPRLSGLGRRHAIRRSARSRPRTPTAGTGGAAGSSAFREQAANLSAAAARSPFTISWGGLVVLADDDEAAAAKAERLGAGDHVIVGGPDSWRRALRAYVDAGADWLMIGPSTRRIPTTRGSSARRFCPGSAEGRWYRAVTRWSGIDRDDGVPPDQRAAAVRLRDHGRPEDRGPARRRRRHRPRLRQPRHPVARRRGREAGRGGAQPAQPPLLGEPGHPEAAPRDHRPLPAQVRRRARPRDAGVHHHRRQGGLLAPDVGAARPGRRRARAEPVVPDPHLGPDPRRRRGAPRAARARAGLLRQPARGVGGLVAAAARDRAVVPAQPDDRVRRPRRS